MGKPPKKLPEAGTHSLSDLWWLLVLSLLWGASYLFIKVTVAEVPALTLVAGRLSLGAVLLWLLVRFSGQSMPRSLKPWGSFGVMGLFSSVVPWTLVSWGEQHISSGLAALLQATMPLFTALLASFLARAERMSWRKLSGLALGFAGVLILLVPDLRLGQHSGLVGQLAIVASSLSYAGATVFARGQLREYPPLVSAAGQLITGAVVLVPITLLAERPSGLSPSLPAVASWVGLTLLGTVLAYAIYYSLIGRASATFVSTVTYIIPVNGLILGAVVLSEPLTATLGFSLVLILMGVLLARC